MITFFKRLVILIKIAVEANYFRCETINKKLLYKYRGIKIAVEHIGNHINKSVIVRLKQNVD
ncbi:MAG: hypothetical protein COA57_00065 [Flavobacteriales bacterium]|nr:MAG: hypothetical protein COA57_00065 [Flavobacteriales bacterium]